MVTKSSTAVIGQNAPNLEDHEDSDIAYESPAPHKKTKVTRHKWTEAEEDEVLAKKNASLL